MAVQLTAQERSVLQKARDYSMKYWDPHTEEWETSYGAFPGDAIKHMSEHGYYGMGIAKELGGSGYSWLESALAYEGLAYGDAGMVCYLLLLNNVTYGLVNYCEHSDEVKQFLPDLISGKKTIAFALTEAHSGSDVARNQCTATLKEDGYHIDGEKVWILNTKHADHIVVTTWDKSTEKMIMLLVDKGTPGMIVGDNIPRMGCNVMYLSSLTFQDCVVPVQRVVSRDAFKTSLRFIDIPRVFVPAACIGLAQRALDLTAEYLADRYAFGKSMLENQWIQFKMAEYTASLEAGRWLTYHTATLMDEGDSQASLTAAMNKLYGPELAMEITTACVQWFGAAGYARNSKVSRLMDAAKMLQIVDGTSEIQRLIIGRKILKSQSVGK